MSTTGIDPNAPWTPGPARSAAPPAVAPHPETITWCRFYIRTPAGEGLFHYQPLTITAPDGQSRLPTPHPPAVGDLITLFDQITQQGGGFRVVDRCWHHASYLSMNWPVMAALPVHGPSLDVIVEPADGLFADEAPTESEPAP
jgi:hypothetical protein